MPLAATSSVMTALKRKSSQPLTAVLLRHFEAEEALLAGRRKNARSTMPARSQSSTYGTASACRNARNAERSASCSAS